MDFWFTADLHFGHRNVIKYCNRPFQNENEMDEALISNWNSKVKKNDIIWIIGDVSFRDVEGTAKVLKQLKGVKNLVLGNHDQKIRTSAELQSYFNEIHPCFLGVNFPNKHGMHEHFVMCHYPMESWDRSHYGTVHLHGHSHGNIPFNKEKTRLDVGTDCHDYSPINLYEIYDIFGENKEGPSTK